jgi:hypothetical protein
MRDLALFELALFDLALFDLSLANLQTLCGQPLFDVCHGQLT